MIGSARMSVATYSQPSGTRCCAAHAFAAPTSSTRIPGRTWRSTSSENECSVARQFLSSQPRSRLRYGRWRVDLVVAARTNPAPSPSPPSPRSRAASPRCRAAGRRASAACRPRRDTSRRSGRTRASGLRRRASRAQTGQRRMSRSGIVTDAAYSVQERTATHLLNTPSLPFRAMSARRRDRRASRSPR